MEKIRKRELLQLSLEERVKVVNEELKTKSLKQVVSELEMNKIGLKEMLKPYQYNIHSRCYELEEKVVTDEKNNEISGLLIDIKKLLQVNNNYQESLNQTITKLTSDRSIQEKKYKEQENEELITRSFKIYDSINERLKIATKRSELNQQQLFNSLLDQSLKNIGF